MTSGNGGRMGAAPPVVEHQTGPLDPAIPTSPEGGPSDIMVEPSATESTDPLSGYEGDLVDLAHTATDWHWSEVTGACGGCGSTDCHPGVCPQNSNGYCTTCPTRRDTGEVRGR